MPKISIITPVFCDISQKVDWLDGMIQSVISQTLADWEIILIDDKSPLPFDQIKEKYANDNRLRWFANVENNGPAKTRNTAVALAQSECILPLDADDLLANPEALENMYDVWLMDTTQIIYGNLQTYTLADSGGSFKRNKVIELGQYTFELAMNLQGIMPVTAMHSKDCHYDSGGWKPEFDEGLEDVEYWIFAGKQGYCGQKINHTTLVYRRQENSRAHKLRFVNKKFEAMQQKIKAMHSDIYSGRFPVACCGKQNSTSMLPVNDPMILSQQSVGINRIVTLEDYEGKTEWVLYNGGKTGRFDVLIHGPPNLPSRYAIHGKGQIFQIPAQHHDNFVKMQRSGFVMNQPDPRDKEPEPEPIIEPVTPQVIEVPKPKMSTLVRVDAIAAETLEVDVQPSLNFNDDSKPNQNIVKEQYPLSSLELSENITNTLNNNSWTVENLSEALPEQLSSLPYIGVVRAKNIIAKAQELINST